MSGMLAGAALAAQRTAGLPLGTALLTAGGVLVLLMITIRNHSDTVPHPVCTTG